MAKVYPDAKGIALANNMNFFNQCLKRFLKVSFSLQQDAEPYLVVHHKTYAITQSKVFKKQLQRPDLDNLFEQILVSR